MSLKNHYKTIDKVIEYGFYVYICVMFLARGEGIRNLLIFGGFALWLLTLKHRQDLYILKDNVAKLCLFYAGTFLVGAVFSLDPLFSFIQLKGDPLRFALMVPVIATVMSDRARLQKAVYATFFAMLFIVSFGYYSYLTTDLTVLKPHTELVHAYHNRFAGYINTMFPVVFLLYFLLREKWMKIIFTVLLIFCVLALILSTSRGGYLAFFGIVFVWTLYFSKKRGFSFRKIIACIIVVAFIIGAVSYAFFPDVKAGMSRSETGNLLDFNARTEIWEAGFQAFLERPLFGWGYGERFFHMEEPFEGTSYEAPEKGQHNQFLTVLFHQGIVGFIPYLLIVVMTIVTFWKEALKSEGIKSYMLIACVAVFFGNYMLHSIFESMFRLTHLAFVLGLGLAAKGIHESSHS